MKNELFVFDRPKRSEEDDFLKKICDKYPSIKASLIIDPETKIKDDVEADSPFNLVLISNDKDNSGIKFTMSADSNRNDLVCNAYKDNKLVDVLKPFSIDKDVNKVALFILNNLKKLSVMNESVQLSSFDCENLATLIKDKLDEDCFIDVNDDNADYGFVNISVDCNHLMNDYDIEAEDYNLFNIKSGDEELGTAKSFDEVSDLIANHFKDKFINIESKEENMNKELESRIAKLEKLISKNEAFEVDAEEVWNAADAAEKTLRDVRNAVEVIDDEELRDLVADVIYALGMVKSRCDAIAEDMDDDE